MDLANNRNITTYICGKCCGNTKKVLGEANRLFYDFLWDSQDQVKTSIPMEQYVDGCLKVPHLPAKLQTREMMSLKGFCVETATHGKNIQDFRDMKTEETICFSVTWSTRERFRIFPELPQVNRKCNCSFNWHQLALITCSYSLEHIRISVILFKRERKENLFIY